MLPTPVLNVKGTLLLLLFTFLQSSAQHLCSLCECHLITLDCSNRSISQIPGLVGETNASLLFFNHNSIKHVRQFPKLPIRELILAHNKITDIDDSAFKNLFELIVLDLSHNLLNSEKLLPQIFRGIDDPHLYEPLRRLLVLNLAYNNLHSLNSDIFEHLPNLETLTLNGNHLRRIEPRVIVAITKVPFLKKLNLANTALKNLPENLFHQIRHLQSLDLSDNLFAEPPVPLESSHRLEWLALNGNPFVRIRKFPILPFLQTLHLSRMPQLISIENRSLSSLIQLEEFYCTNNPKLVQIDRTVFSYVNESLGEGEIWPPLKSLVLRNNSLRTLESHLVGRWDYLKQIDIQHNPWLCDCENQWMVFNLVPLMEKMHRKLLEDVKCGLPPEMENMLFSDLYYRNYEMRCLDLYNHKPEKDGKFLIDVFIFVVFLVPFLMGAILYYKNYLKLSKLNKLKKFYRYSQLDLVPFKNLDSINT